MIESGLFWLFVTGAVLTCGAATGGKVLQEFSLRELEHYCRRRRRESRFSEIVSQHDEVVLGTETIQLIGSSLMLVAGVLWFFRPWIASEPPSVRSILAMSASGCGLLLLTASWIPWAVARMWAEPFIFHTWTFWSLAHRAMWPVTTGTHLVDGLFRRLAGVDEPDADEEEAFEDEIRAIVTEGMVEGLLDQDAGGMIDGVIELGDRQVGSIMTPRTEIDALDLDWGWDEAVKFVAAVGRTRIPVYQEKLDHVVGILYVKDLFAEMAKPEAEQQRDLGGLLREPTKILKTKHLDDMLREFLDTRKHLALVVDEYNALEGLLTIEDVLEEIVGEIIDEHDDDEAADIHPVDENTTDARGTAQLDELNQLLGINLPEEEEFDTIGGLLTMHLGRIPRVGDHLVYDGMRISVLAANPRHVERVRLERLERLEESSPRE